MKFLIFVFLCVFFKIIECRAFGQRVEYRYEYDPRRDSEPRVRVKFDDVTDEDELMKIFNHRKPKDVRKSPSKYGNGSNLAYQQRFITSDDVERDYYQPKRRFRSTGWQNVPYAETQNWHNGLSSLPVHKFFDSSSNIAEQMSSFLRQQSQQILSSEFPDQPRDTFSDPPHFHFIHHHQQPKHHWFY